MEVTAKLVAVVLVYVFVIGVPLWIAARMKPTNSGSCRTRE
jgi:hypothetical protein